MSTEFDSRLTARAASILTAMLDNVPDAPSSFAALLRRKLNNSNICFGSDIPSGVVTLNSQVLYTVDGELAGPHLIVLSEGHDFPDYALSIHDIRGLALLGLSEGQSIHIEEDDVAPTMLAVVKVGFQGRTSSLAGDARPRGTSRVVPLLSKRVATAPGFEPDDPGPSAA